MKFQDLVDRACKDSCSYYDEAPHPLTFLKVLQTNEASLAFLTIRPRNGSQPVIKIRLGLEPHFGERAAAETLAKYINLKTLNLE